MPRHSDVVVAGAGAFGGWTAFQLLQRGARVTLLDPWGPGHARGTSSGESRVLRAGYGGKTIYTEWAWRALALWKRWQQQWHTPLFVPSGVLWLCAKEDDYVRASLAALRQGKIPYERLSSRELARRYPQVRLEGIRFGYLETRAGFLRARLATQTVAAAVAQGGGRVLRAAAAPPARPVPRRRRGARRRGPRLDWLHLSDGRRIHAGCFVFACGPWLPQMFPQLLASRIRVSKQEVFFFGPPAGDHRFDVPALPVWVDIARDLYGVPAHEGRGFKVASDRSGPPFDPTTGERAATPENVQAARRYLAERFPALAAAPLVETHVCQYERTPDSHLVIDRHPDYENVWLVGGGSGHGFKLGPALGEFVARQALEPGRESIPAEMRLGAIAFPVSGDVAPTRSF